MGGKEVKTVNPLFEKLYGFFTNKTLFIPYLQIPIKKITYMYE
jgi:hypothetical protein